MTALLDGRYEELPNLTVTGGEVQLNLISALATVLRSVVQDGVDGLGFDVTVPEIPTALEASEGIARLEGTLSVDLPEDFAQVTVMTG